MGFFYERVQFLLANTFSAPANIDKDLFEGW